MTSGPRYCSQRSPGSTCAAGSMTVGPRVAPSAARRLLGHCVPSAERVLHSPGSSRGARSRSRSAPTTGVVWQCFAASPTCLGSGQRLLSGPKALTGRPASHPNVLGSFPTGSRRYPSREKKSADQLLRSRAAAPRCFCIRGRTAQRAPPPSISLNSIPLRLGNELAADGRSRTHLNVRK